MDFTPEDERLIKEKWEELLQSCTKICKNDEDWEFIKRAFFLAKEAHGGVRRRSGEPYLLHPIAVAKIVVDEIGLGVKSVVAALLHDVVEDTEYTVEDMERIFGPKIAKMVDGLTKMSGVFNADTSEQAEYFRKVLLTLSDDVRVILIKIADRLHNMRTLGSMPTNKQIKITGETLYLFAPLAYRLGLYTIKSELEDLCMKYRFPVQYAELSEKLKATEEQREAFISKFNAPIIEALKRDHINFEISGRVKSLYSIWSKMQRKQIPFEEIYDLFAVRIVFKSLPFPSEKTQCWQIYSTITDIYTPKPDRLRDWISMPKYGADGTVEEVTLNTVKVRNWDNTIVTLPPYLLVSDSFQNWEGMRSSGGRRVKRSINIDMTSIRFCTPEMLERYKRIDLLKDYIARTQQRVEEYNRQHDIPSGEDKINGLHQTNIGVFRNYLNLYLRQNERVNQNMMVLVRQLQPTEQGLPMELYFFTDTVDWVPYEGIQADVFDHVLAVIPEFDLRVFQNPSGNDLRTLTGKTDTNH